MDASRNSARNELKEFSLKFINVLINILASQWSRNDEGENRIDSNNKAVEHSLCVLLARRLVRGVIAHQVPLLLPGACDHCLQASVCPPASAALCHASVFAGREESWGRFAQSPWEKYKSQGKCACVGLPKKLFF